MDWFSKDTFTAIAAGVAAFTGFWGWVKSWGRDSTYIKFGSYYTETYGGLSLLVHNLSPHEVLIIDVGFIKLDGKANSLVELECLVGEHPDYHLGNKSIPSRGVCRGRLEGKNQTAKGAFVITSDQWFYRMAFDSSLPMKERLCLRFKWYKRSIRNLLRW